jgi:hypothetical protein
VVLHLCDQDRVALAYVRAAPRIRDEVDRLGHVLGEDRRLWIGAREGRNATARAVVGRVSLLCERVDPAVHVCVVPPQMFGDRLDHDPRLL